MGISLPEISLTTWFVRIAFDMTFQQELSSWAFPKSVSTSPVPEIWSKAPSSSKLSLPSSDRKPTIVTFLRHCVALLPKRHSATSATTDWLDSIGGKGNVRIIVDDKRELYGKWGL